jgi:hypothetical protein
VRPTLRIASAVLACAGWAAATPAQEPPAEPAPAQQPRAGQQGSSGQTPMPAGGPEGASTPQAPPAPGRQAGQKPAAKDPPARARRAARRRPIHDSVDRVVDAVVDAHMQPCDAARQQGVPCFPVSVEQEGPRFSVAEALRRYRTTGGPAPGMPTNAELQHQMSGAPQSASGGVSFDLVCTAKNLVKKLSGGGGPFYLYRMWDQQGVERPLLTDHEIDPRSYAANPAVRYDFLGKFGGECEAVAAWREALRKAVEPKPTPDDWSKQDRSPQ